MFSGIFDLDMIPLWTRSINEVKAILSILEATFA